ncbi:MAG TPA: PAS domain-containing protein [Acidimicrobiales bacterium]|nr:PAS domain-containing protein [Acidimicrobiales bacterium]
MREPTVRPSGVERTFGTDEIIVTKTDTKGFIRYANDVFLRVSGYREEDVLGRPHNLVRHPEMPRCIFKLLWSTIAGGEEIFAYVVNLAADGAHYWVLAHVTPSFSRSGTIVGYHSNRRSPARSAVKAVRPLYDELLREERHHAHPPDAIAASSELLERRLAEARTTYDEFVWSLTTEETLR